MHPLVRQIEELFLPDLERLASQMRGQFPALTFNVWHSPTGALTEYQGYDVGLECVFPQAGKDAPDNVAVMIGLLTPAGAFCLFSVVMPKPSYNPPRMMSETTLGFLSTLTYRADAKRQVCWLPLGGIYWEDEMPDIHHLMNIPEDDRNQIFRLFGIRVRLWKGEPLLDAEQQFWDTMYSRVPSWAFFRRQQISDDDQRAQEQAEQGTADALEALLADADQVTIRERDGVQHFSATFDLTKGQTPSEKKRPWWERVFGQKRVPKK